MRLLAIAIFGMAVGCGSTLGSPDGGGAGGAPCVRDGVTYPAGAAVPSGDCNGCFCAANGSISCTLINCPTDAGTCSFDTTYSYGETGGLVAYEDVATLAPPTSYTHERTWRLTDPPDVSCAPAMPPCGLEDRYGPSDIMRAIADPDVQAALAAPAPPTYGLDARPVDGTIFQFRRADGRGFLAGGTCDRNIGLPGPCVAVPAGITRLVNGLRALDEQQLADPSCAALR
jgi:hypothetical protein